MNDNTCIHNTLSMYNKFCDDFGMDGTVNFDMNIKTMLLIFQKNLDLRKCYVDIWPSNPFIDWEMLDQIRAMKIFKNASSWITVLQYVDVNADDLEWKQFVIKNKLFAHFLHCLQSSNVTFDVIKKLNQRSAVQLFLLIHISNLNALNAFETYFAMNHNTNVKSQAMNFLSAFADILFDKEDRSEAVTTLMKQFIIVNVTQFSGEMELQKSKMTKLECIFKQKNLQAVNLRPRLRTKVKREILEESALATLDTFQNWCDKIRFANVFSQSYKKKIYFAMSQRHVDIKSILPNYFGEPEMCQVVLQYQVALPDVDILTEVILQSRLICEPFPEIHKFRELCFGSFSLQQKSKLRLNDLLHLYIASYQNETIWKDIWKNLISIISTQIIKDIEHFVAQHKFNETAVMNIIFHGNASSA